MPSRNTIKASQEIYARAEELQEELELSDEEIIEALELTIEGF